MASRIKNGTATAVSTAPTTCRPTFGSVTKKSCAPCENRSTTGLNRKPTTKEPKPTPHTSIKRSRPAGRRVVEARPGEPPADRIEAIARTGSRMKAKARPTSARGVNFDDIARSYRSLPPSASPGNQRHTAVRALFEASGRQRCRCQAGRTVGGGQLSRQIHAEILPDPGRPARAGRRSVICGELGRGYSGRQCMHSATRGGIRPCLETRRSMDDANLKLTA